MTLNKLIEELIAIRSQEPHRAEQDVYVFDGNSGEILQITYIDVSISDRIDINTEN